MGTRGHARSAVEAAARVDRLRRGDVIRLAGGESATLDELPWLDGDGLRRARVKLADGSPAEAAWPSRFAEPIVVPRPS